ncbi:MAG: hypothetical protein GF411_08485 [Candidatus Lokiarchaeota archaeon]|nr:hypothetical protein [Candidatus Lokiarchaeota archaeon]
MDKAEFLKIKEELKEEIKDMSRKQVENRKNKGRRCWDRAAEITALLNYYHEHRGSNYRHGTEGHKLRGVKYYYIRKMKEIRGKYEPVLT